MSLRFDCQGIDSAPEDLTPLLTCCWSAKREKAENILRYLEGQIKNNEETILKLTQQREAQKRPTKFTKREIKRLLS